MMSRTLPARPNLEHLKKQAKGLLRDYLAGDADAVQSFGTRKPGALPPRLADAQHAVARQYGFSSWALLKHNVESLVGTDAASALEAAVRLGDASRVRDVLARFPSIASILDSAMPNGDFGATPLLAAVHLGNREMIEVLLKAGANINQRSHWWAGGFGVLGRDADLNAFLLARGAVMDAHDAAEAGMLDTVKDLIATDPTVVHARFGDGQTPLHVASTVEIAELLLDNGADIDALDVDHESTPAQYLIRDHQDVVRYLISRGCKTDILMACATGDLELVRRHLSDDPHSIWTTVSPKYFPMADSRAGGSIYIWTLGNLLSAHAVAREFGHEDVLELLMEHTPASLALALAYEAGDEGEVNRLKGRNPKLDIQLNDELRAKLPAAARANNGVGVHLMLAAGWPVSARNDRGETALHWAAFHGNAGCVTELLQTGADVTIKDTAFDGTPLGWARYGADNSWLRESGDYPSVVSALNDVGAK
jgi:ankyrin repeat protein